MREIKFRAWDKTFKRFCVSYEIEARLFLNPQERPNDTGKFYIHDNSNSGYDNIELSQYTGLKDKNGKEIYEGDIITSPHLSKPYEVIWKNGYGFLASRIQLMVYWPAFKIIGNIYENPKLGAK